jgi:hypothetical protein
MDIPETVEAVLVILRRNNSISFEKCWDDIYVEHKEEWEEEDIALDAMKNQVETVFLEILEEERRYQ